MPSRRFCRRCKTQFNHATLIAVDDPQRGLFELPADQGVIDLRITANTGWRSRRLGCSTPFEGIVARAIRGLVWASWIGDMRAATTSSH
jgi:6-pyruvoyltetrahydropterin/6-carboxytetrahydropterin synthase